MTTKLKQNSKKLNGCCYSYQVKTEFYRMNSGRALTVIVSAMRAGSVDRVRRSFVSDGTL